MPEEAGTARAPQPQPGTHQVIITRTKTHAEDSLRVVPGRFEISVEKKEQVEWFCPTHDWAVDFVDESPFDDKHFEGKKGEHKASGLSDKSKVGREFRYTVTVSDIDGKNVLDPTGQVNQ
jgi:hypothetical protein